MRIVGFLHRFPVRGIKYCEKTDGENRMSEMVFLVLALVLDNFAAGMGYGSDGIRIPWKMAVLLNLICSLTLALAMCLGKEIDLLISPDVLEKICFVSFMMLGGIKFIDYFRKRFSCRSVERKQPVKKLSLKETVFLSFAMSTDGILSAPFAAMLGISVAGTSAAVFVMGMITMYAGYFLGKALWNHRQCDLSFLGGLAFLFLAVTKCSLWS